jgi:hypothetical protein
LAFYTLLDSCSSSPYLKIHPSYLFWFSFFWVDWGLNLGLLTWKQLLHHVSHVSSPPFLWLFWRQGLMNYFPRLVLNHDPPDVSLPSS